MTYRYVAYDSKGKVVKGKLTASSEETATEILGYANYKVISLKPFVPFINFKGFLDSPGKIKHSEIILFYRQLAILLESGTDIGGAIELLQEQVNNRTFKKALGDIATNVRIGNQLSKVLQKYPRLFPPTYTQLLRIGEQGGDLDVLLRQVADYMEKEAASTKKTKDALKMPVFTSIIAIVVIGLLITFILPSFNDLYGSLGVELPAIAKLFIQVGEFSQHNGMYVLAGLGALLVGAYYYFRTSDGKYKWDKLLLRMPLLGRVRLLNELARFCRSMALLLRSGMPLSEVMALSIKGTDNRVLAEAFVAVEIQMLKGEGISKPMSQNKLFLPMMTQMVKVGEQAGNLDITLQSVASSFEAEAEEKMRNFSGMIQPVMTLVIGGMVGTIALTLVSAMTAMYDKGI